MAMCSRCPRRRTTSECVVQLSDSFCSSQTRLATSERFCSLQTCIVHLDLSVYHKSF